LFCPSCGSTIAYTNEGLEGLVAIPIGAFADPDFPAPSFSVYEHRKHAWVEITASPLEHEGLQQSEKANPSAREGFDQGRDGLGADRW
jgi:hypothetical protein